MGRRVAAVGLAAVGALLTIGAARLSAIDVARRTAGWAPLVITAMLTGIGLVGAAYAIAQDRSRR